jgi:hypothetical protein
MRWRTIAETLKGEDMRRGLGIALIVAMLVPAAAAYSAPNRRWAPRVEVTVLCYRDTGTYEVAWKVVNTQPGRRMRVLSTTRDLNETFAGTTAVSLTQKARVVWRWREDGALRTKRGRASATLQLNGTCRIPTIEVAVTSSAIHSGIDVYWGNLDSDSSATNILTPFSAVVPVDLDYDIVSLLAFEDDGLNTTLTCLIKMDGVAVERASAQGPNSSCDVSHIFELSEPIAVEG